MTVPLPRIGPLMALALLAAADGAMAACAPLGFDSGALAQLKADGFVIDPTRRDALVLGLADCLGEADPALRDGIGYEGLATILRAGDVPPGTLGALEQRLLAMLDEADPSGVRRPFAVLALAEVARADRLKPFLSADRRSRLLEAGARYLETLTDYRGFVAHEGWRHGVAHGADLMMQLGMNPLVDRTGLQRILRALGSQVGPTAHSYVHGESERLARAVIQLARRNLLTAGDWTDWFGKLGDPSPLARWEEAFQSEAGLARRHNVRAFALAVHAAATESADPSVAALRPGAVALLAATG